MSELTQQQLLERAWQYIKDSEFLQYYAPPVKESGKRSIRKLTMVRSEKQKDGHAIYVVRLRWEIKTPASRGGHDQTQVSQNFLLLDNGDLYLVKGDRYRRIIDVNGRVIIPRQQHQEVDDQEDVDE